MNPDDLAKLLAQFGVKPDATRVNQSWLQAHMPAPEPITPDIAQRVLNTRATMQGNRSVGPRTQGNIPINFKNDAIETMGSAGEALMGGARMHPVVNALASVPEVAKDALGGKYGAAALGAGLAAAPFIPAGKILKGMKALATGAEDAAPAATQVFDHYSNADLSGGVLDPAYMGTGLPGRERAIPGRPLMSHVYTPGARPEPQFKNMPKYNVHVAGSIYDVADDPLGIAAKAAADVRAGRVNGDVGTVFEKRLKKVAADNGIAGYTHSENSPNVVKLFGEHPVTPDGVPLGAVADSAAIGVARNGLHDAADVLKMFQQQSGARNLPRVTSVDAEKASHMAKLYEALPKHDPAAAPAYDALNREVDAQFKAIQDAGHTINFVDHDPYKNSKEMIADVRDNRNLNVFKTPTNGEFHPYMTPEQNDKFRAVHDWLAHAGEGHSFGPIGEENAYRVHSSTLSPEAQRALATETRGQNSWVNFGPNSHLPVTERPYAEQKAALWPQGFTGDYDEMDMPVTYKPGAQSVAKADPAMARRALLGDFPGSVPPAGAGSGIPQHLESAFDAEAQGPRDATPQAPSVITPPSSGDVFDNSMLGSHLPPGFTDERPPLKYPTARTDVSMFDDLDRRFRRVYTPNVERALAADPRSGGWYDTSHLRQAFIDHSPNGAADFEQFMKFMGPTSTGTTVPGNIRQASKFYELWKSGQLSTADLENGTLSPPPGYANRRQSSINAGIRRILENGNLDPLTQPKTYRYANQLAGRAWGGAALDMHVGRQVGKQGLIDAGDGALAKATGFPQSSYNVDRAVATSPQNNHYAVIEDALVKEAKRLGLPPAVYQAAGWVGGAKKTGVADPRNFMDLMNQILKNSAVKYNHASPLDALKAFIKGQSPLWGVAGTLGLGGAASAGSDNR